MNKQIEDLMYRAGLTAQGCWDEMDAYDKQAIEKFAELLLKECIQVVDDTMTENQDMNIGLVMASAAIVSHFEIEE